MNRRQFLGLFGRTLAAAAVVPSALLGAAGEIAAPAPLIAPMYDEAVKRWSAQMWSSLPNKVYWSQFMDHRVFPDPGRVIQIKRLRVLS